MLPEEMRELLVDRLERAEREERHENGLAFTLVMKGVNLLGVRGELLSVNYDTGLNNVGFTNKQVPRMLKRLDEELDNAQTNTWRAEVARRQPRRVRRAN